MNKLYSTHTRGIVYINIDGWGEEKGLILLEEAEEQGWGVIGVGEVHADRNIRSLLRGEKGKKWEWKGYRSEIVKGRRGVGCFIRREIMGRTEVWQGQGQGGEEGMWVRLKGMKNGGDLYVHMVYWAPKVVDSADNLMMVIGGVAEKVELYRGLGAVVVMGDVNIDVRRKEGRYKRMTERWEEWLKEERMIDVLGLAGKGDESTHDRGGVLDRVVVTEEAAGRIRRSFVGRERLWTDHRMVGWWVEMEGNRKEEERKKSQEGRWIWKTTGMENWEEYEKEIEKEMYEWMEGIREDGVGTEKRVRQRWIDGMYEDMVGRIKRAAEKVVGRKWVRNGGTGKGWFTEKVKNEVMRARRIEEDLVARHGKREGRKMYREMGEKQRVKRVIRGAQREDVRDKLRRARQGGYGSKEFWRYMKALKGADKGREEDKGGDKEWVIGGIEMGEKEEARKGVEEFWVKMGREEGKQGEEEETFRQKIEEAGELRRGLREKGPEWCEESFKMGEVEGAMKKLEGKKWKASGGDGVCNWMMVYGGVGMKKAIMKLANMVWEGEVQPREWRRNKVIYLYKGKGDRKELNNNRPVTMISNVGKVITRLWWTRLEAEIGGGIDDCQYGFRKGRGVEDVWWIMEAVLDGKGKKYVGFIDFSKAFDRVWREGLWYKLYEKGVKGKMWRMIQEWYKDSAVKAEWRGVKTGWIGVEEGVRQGCILSGLLFLVYVDDLLKELKDGEEGVRIGGAGKEGVRVNAVMYADDLEIFGREGGDLIRKLELIERWSKKWKMEVSIEKSEVVVFGAKEIEREGGWKMGTGVIRENNEARCLGTIFEKGREKKVTGEKRAGKMAGVINMLRETRKILGERAAVIAWKAFGMSMGLYGAQVIVWDTKRVRDRMDRLHREALRVILGLDKGANEGILYGETGEKKMSAVAEQRSLEYGRRIQNTEEDGMRWKIWKIRGERKGDRWGKYIRGVRRSLGWEGEGEETGSLGIGKEVDIEALLGIREQRKWRERLEKSKSTMEIYRECVKEAGEMKWTQRIEGSEEWKVWWRRFRGGMELGRNRRNGWRERGCIFCGDEDGGIGHFVLRCERREVRLVGTEVLRECEQALGEQELVKWQTLDRSEQLWRTMGKDRENFEGAWRAGPKAWDNEWREGGWKARLEAGGWGGALNEDGDGEDSDEEDWG